MIIEKIDIRSFGLITDMTLEFSEGVNVIEGQNESGKTTIAAFIKYMLFGFGGVESDGVVSERKKRLNWNTGLAQGSMVVRVKGKRYLVSRSTVPVDEGGRSTYKEDSSIIDLESGTTAFGKLPASEVFFGVSRDLFENTAFVGKIGDAGINEGAVSESIENILFSGSEQLNNRRAMAKISDRMEALLHTTGHGGVIYDLVRKKEDLESALKLADEDNKQILVKEAELHRIRMEKEEAVEKLEKYHDLDSSYKNVMLIQTFDKLHELEEECVQKSTEYNRFIEDNTHAGFVPTEQYLTDLVCARKKVSDTNARLNEKALAYEKEKNAIGITREIENAIAVSDSMGGEEKIKSRALALKSGTVKNIVLTSLMGVVALAAVIYEICATGALAGVIWRILGAILGAGALVGAGIFAYMISKNNSRLKELSANFGVDNVKDLVGKLDVIASNRAKRDGMISSTESAKVALEEAELDYENAKGELNRLIVRWGEIPRAADFDTYLDELEATVSEFLAKKRVLFEDKSNCELTVREIRRTLSDVNEIDIRAQVSPLRRKTLSTINHDEIVTGIASNKAKIAEQDKLAFAVENELSELKTGAGDPGDYFTKINALESRVDELGQRHKAYFLALRTIEQATDNLRAEISPRLSDYSTELMEIMTEKKYTGFSVDGTLKLNFRDKDGVEKSVDFLSGGTRDLAYIAMRMALIDMLYTEKPPVCFDESFAHQDNVRARAMMKALKYLADEGHQSFVFTCRGREAVLAGELFKSPGVYKLSVAEEDIG